MVLTEGWRRGRGWYCEDFEGQYYDGYASSRNDPAL